LRAGLFVCAPFIHSNENGKLHLPHLFGNNFLRDFLQLFIGIGIIVTNFCNPILFLDKASFHFSDILKLRRKNDFKKEKACLILNFATTKQAGTMKLLKSLHPNVHLYVHVNIFARIHFKAHRSGNISNFRLPSGKTHADIPCKYAQFNFTQLASTQKLIWQTRRMC
jgi:hypothetical protein